MVLSRQCSFKLLSILLVYSIYRFVIEKNTPLSVNSLEDTLIISGLAVMLYLFSHQPNYYLKSNFLSSSLIFLIGFVFVHEINYLALVTGLYHEIIDANITNLGIVNEAAICTSCSLLSYLIGCVCCNKPFKGIAFNQNIKSFKFIDKILLLLVFVFYFFTDKKFFQSGYTTMANEEGLPLVSAVSRNMILGCQLALSAFIVVSKSCNLSFKQYVKSYSLAYYIAILIYLYLVLISGERSPLIVLITCYFSAYFIVSRKKIRFVWGIVILVFAVFVLNLLTTMRFLGSPYTFDKFLEACNIFNAILSNPTFFFDATKQLANQVGIYHYMYDISRETILYGAGMGYQVLGIIPGLRYVFSLLINFDSSVLSVSQIATKNLNDGLGAGNACEADVIYNFGSYGTMVFFFLFGFFLKKLDLSLYSKNPKIYVVIFGLAYLSYAIYIARSICLWPLNSCAYAILFVYLENRILKKRHH